MNVTYMSRYIQHTIYGVAINRLLFYDTPHFIDNLTSKNDKRRSAGSVWKTYSATKKG